MCKKGVVVVSFDSSCHREQTRLYYRSRVSNFAATVAANSLLSQFNYPAEFGRLRSALPSTKESRPTSGQKCEI